MICDKCKFNHDGICEKWYTSEGLSYWNIDDNDVGLKNGFTKHNGYYTRMEE